MSKTYKQLSQNSYRFKSGVVILCFVQIGGSLVLAALLYRHVYPPLQKSALTSSPPTQLPATTPSTNYSIPARLQVQSLGIDAPVINVGNTDDGNMDVPTSVDDVGWYKYGALPGNEGTSVMAGHVSGVTNEPGVFKNLDKLTKGDAITVIGSNGQVVTFIVRESKNYPYSAQPDEVFKSTNGSHLNLITCTGNWDNSENQFKERLVVFADKAP